jgi:hypothetical protein
VQQGPRAAAGGRTKRCCSETIWRARVLTHSLKRSNYDICRHHAQNHSASVGVSNSRCYILRESVLLLLLLLRAVSVEAADKRRGNSVTELDVRITASEATGVDLQLFSGNLQSSGVDVLRRPGSSSSSSSSSSSIESCSLQRLSVRKHQKC